MNAKIPQAEYINNTKIANQLRKGLVRCYGVDPAALARGAVGFQTDVGRAGREPLITRFSVTSDLTFYDMALADAVFSLYRACATEGAGLSFTATDALRALSGDPSQQLPPARRAIVEASLDRLAGTFLVLDCTQEMAARKQKDAETVFREPFFSLTRSGKTYRLAKMPPLYRYAEQNRQMIYLPRSVLFPPAEQGKKVPSSTDDIILIRRYILQQLELIRNQNNHFDADAICLICRTHKKHPRYIGLLPEIGHLPPERRAEETDEAFLKRESSWKNRLVRLRDNTLTVLEQCRRLGYIDAYEAPKRVDISNLSISITKAKTPPSWSDTPKYLDEFE